MQVSGRLEERSVSYCGVMCMLGLFVRVCRYLVFALFILLSILSLNTLLEGRYSKLVEFSELISSVTIPSVEDIYYFSRESRESVREAFNYLSGGGAVGEREERSARPERVGVGLVKLVEIILAQPRLQKHLDGGSVSILELLCHQSFSLQEGILGMYYREREIGLAFARYFGELERRKSPGLVDGLSRRDVLEILGFERPYDLYIRSQSGSNANVFKASDWSESKLRVSRRAIVSTGYGNEEIRPFCQHDGRWTCSKYEMLVLKLLLEYYRGAGNTFVSFFLWQYKSKIVDKHLVDNIPFFSKVQVEIVNSLFPGLFGAFQKLTRSVYNKIDDFERIRRPHLPWNERYHLEKVTEEDVNWVISLALSHSIQDKDGNIAFVPYFGIIPHSSSIQDDCQRSQTLFHYPGESSFDWRFSKESVGRHCGPASSPSPEEEYTRVHSFYGRLNSIKSVVQYGKLLEEDNEYTTVWFLRRDERAPGGFRLLHGTSTILLSVDSPSYRDHLPDWFQSLTASHHSGPKIRVRPATQFVHYIPGSGRVPIPQDPSETIQQYIDCTELIFHGGAGLGFGTIQLGKSFPVGGVRGSVYVCLREALFRGLQSRGGVSREGVEEILLRTMHRSCKTRVEQLEGVRSLLMSQLGQGFAGDFTEKGLSRLSAKVKQHLRIHIKLLYATLEELQAMNKCMSYFGGLVRLIPRSTPSSRTASLSYAERCVRRRILLPESKNATGLLEKVGSGLGESEVGIGAGIAGEEGEMELNDVGRLLVSMTRKMKKTASQIVHPLTQLEKWLKEATANTNWGCSSTILSEIARSMTDYHDYVVVQKCIGECLSEKPSKWRKIFKTLVLVEYLLKNGIDRFVDDIKEYIYKIRHLQDFHYTEEGRDRGAGIREKSKYILGLLNDPVQLKAERKKARDNRGKYIGINGRTGRLATPAPTSVSVSASVAGIGGGGRLSGLPCSSFQEEDGFRDLYDPYCMDNSSRKISACREDDYRSSDGLEEVKSVSISGSCVKLPGPPGYSGGPINRENSSLGVSRGRRMECFGPGARVAGSPDKSIQNAAQILAGESSFGGGGSGEDGDWGTFVAADEKGMEVQSGRSVSLNPFGSEDVQVDKEMERRRRVMEESMADLLDVYVWGKDEKDMGVVVRGEGCESQQQENLWDGTGNRGSGNVHIPYGL
ncbi:putative transmembrane domain-containing protein [Cryptosporidium canis]|uniref:Transmembrane domain-containing protein n=1 Tax=Cryptosporidium canis TaxID=195482 RepID=A0A9D5HY58_9CRYT|nr:putative transmembrane domain-containing protein [Cryptosporidium canis]